MFKDIPHSQLEAQILHYFEGELDCVQQGRFERHLKICKKCKEKVDKLFLQRLRAHGPEESIKDSKGLYANCLSDGTVEAYVLDKLTDEERRLVDMHLYMDGCTECNLRIEAYQRYQDWLKGKVKIEKKKKIIPVIKRQVVIIWHIRIFPVTLYHPELVAKTRPKIKFSPLRNYFCFRKIKGLTGEVGEIAGKVILYLYSDKNKVEGIDVSICKETENGTLESIITNTTDKDGRIKLGKVLTEGKYLIEINIEGKPQKLTTVSIVENKFTNNIKIIESLLQEDNLWEGIKQYLYIARYGSKWQQEFACNTIINLLSENAETFITSRRIMDGISGRLKEDFGYAQKFVTEIQKQIEGYKIIGDAILLHKKNDFKKEQVLIKQARSILKDTRMPEPKVEKIITAIISKNQVK